jgi:hypothetical protein
MRDSEWEARAVRLILLDLIGKVRREHVGHDYVLQEGKFCMRCQVDWHPGRRRLHGVQCHRPRGSATAGGAR